MSSLPKQSLWGQQGQPFLKTLEKQLMMNDGKATVVLNQAVQQIAESLSTKKGEMFIQERDSHNLAVLGTRDLANIRETNL